MASAADLSGRTIRFGHSGGEVEIISGSVTDQCDVTHYLPVNTTIKRTVAHGRLITWNLMGAILTTAYPFTAFTPGTALTTVFVEPDRGVGATEHASSDVVVGEMVHEFDTSTHQVFRMTLYSDGNYTVPS